MTPFEIARSYIGTKEGAGAADNPKIVAMYASIGQSQVEHDSVAWCAAFVGHCLETAGLRSTRKLTARSYLDWGVGIELTEARAGDIVVFSRGASAWQGHVGFFVAQTGQMIEVLGGNQGDAVNIRRMPAAKLLGVRRAGSVAPMVGLSTREVQKRLGALGYHEVGAADGKIGPRTKAAILAFRQDNDLPLLPVIDQVLIDALRDAAERPVTAERASGKPQGSRILAASNAQLTLGAAGSAGIVLQDLGPLIAQAEDGRDLSTRALDLIGLGAWAPNLMPALGALIFLAVIVFALKSRAARIEDYRSGKTP